QPARRAVVATTGQRDRELDALAAPGPRRHVGRELRGRQKLCEQRAELHLAPAAAHLDVRHHALEIADADGELLHLAETLVHLLEALRHQRERVAQALFQRRLQLLVDGGAHLLELGGVVVAQHLELLLDGRGQRAEALAELRELAALRLARIRQRALRARLELREALADLAPQVRGGIGLLVARHGEVPAHVALVLGGALCGGVEARHQRGRIDGAALAITREHREARQREREERDTADRRERAYAEQHRLDHGRESSKIARALGCARVVTQGLRRVSPAPRTLPANGGRRRRRCRCRRGQRCGGARPPRRAPPRAQDPRRARARAPRGTTRGRG